MGKLKEKCVKVLITAPESHVARLKELWAEKFDFFNEGVRYLFKQEILRHGELPKPIPKGANPPQEHEQPTQTTSR